MSIGHQLLGFADDLEKHGELCYSQGGFGDRVTAEGPAFIRITARNLQAIAQALYAHSLKDLADQLFLEPPVPPPPTPPEVGPSFQQAEDLGA